MRIGIIGTGVVAQTLAAKLSEQRQSVMIGTRNADQTLDRNASDVYGNPPFRVWHQQHPGVELGTFAQAAAHGELVINATAGAASVDALRLAGAEHLNGKVLVDVANPLDFSHGMPPSLVVCNTDSLAEQIQRAFPQARVVKTLNTVTAAVMVNPGAVAEGDHHLFVSGNDPEAKAQVMRLLGEWFGWRHVIDLGDITTARGVEMFLPLWVRLFGPLQTPMFNIKIVK